jgi:membrane dipeptidase
MRYYYFIIFFSTLSNITVGQDVKKVSRQKATELVKNILTTNRIIEGHSDFYHRYYTCSSCPRDIGDYPLDKLGNGNTNIPLYRKGSIGGQLYNVYGKDRDMLNLLGAFDLMWRYENSYPNDIQIIGTASELRAAIKANKIGLVPILEGAVLLQNNMSLLRMYYQLGLRSVTFAYKTNDLADGSDDQPKHNGVSEFGREMIREMNRLGIIIDISHVSAKSMSDVLEETESPVIFSHSNAYQLCKVNRNVPDSILFKLKENKGIIMINFVPYYVSQRFSDWMRLAEKSWTEKVHETRDTVAADKYYNEVWLKQNPQPTVTVSEIADHFDYIKGLIGVDYIGIGSDLGAYYEFTIKDMDNVGCFPELLVELTMRGWTASELKKISSENFLRVFESVENNAKEIKKKREPSTLKKSK